MATFDLSSGTPTPRKPVAAPADPLAMAGKMFNSRQEDDNPYAPAVEPERVPAPGPAAPSVPVPSHDSYAAVPDRDPSDPFNGMFDARLSDQTWANTPEGLAESNRQNDYLQQHKSQSQGGPQNGDYRSWFTNLFAGKQFNQETLVGMEPYLNQNGIKIEPANSLGERHKLRLPDGSVVRVGFGEGVPVWIQQSGPGGGSSFQSNPFDDPATKGYIDQLNARIHELQTPQQNPEMDSLLKYLGDYFKQLQSPVYTDAQRDVINTQTINPMEHQRTARKQQVLQQMASRGMGPSDGPTIQALQDVDRQFDQMRTGAQGGFALNEINLGKQNQAQAVNVGTAAAQLRDGIFGQQDARSGQALNIARQIPDMAQQRIQQAITMLSGNQSNPASLFAALNSAQHTGMDQHAADSKYWTDIMAAIAQAFGLG